MAALFTVDLEDWDSALHTAKGNHSSIEEVYFILAILRKYQIRAIFYVLGRFNSEYPEVMGHLQRASHVIGSHGYFHNHNETITPDISYYTHEFRSPYWDTTPMPMPPSGGVFFRIMPMAYLKWAINKSGVFWIHPHDLDEDHPKLRDPLMNWKRHVGLLGSKKKLDRLVGEIEWAEP